MNRYAGEGSFSHGIAITSVCFGSPSEPKVIVSTSLGHSVLFKLRRPRLETSLSQIRLDHDLRVMDGLNQFEYVHSTASELSGPRVYLTFRWISQHIGGPAHQQAFLAVLFF